MTNPEKIQFNNSQGYTDTFLYYKKVVVGTESQTLSLSLHRITSLCRFVVNDAIPEGVAKLEFTYKGGSGSFDASTGYGCVNSTQVMKYDVQAGMKQTQYDLYTFLHSTEGSLNLKVTAYDASGNMLFEKSMGVDMYQNQITWLKGNAPAGPHRQPSCVNGWSPWAPQSHSPSGPQSSCAWSCRPWVPNCRFL